MYRGFKLEVQKTDFRKENSEQMEYWKKQGEQIKSSLQKHVNRILAEVTNSDGVIDGEALADIWFPIGKKDIFLSYSHDDEELALIITGILKDIFDLNVFMDELIWGSADELLKAIDVKYCKCADGTYDYKKRNFSTSHVHAMLATSIIKAMDQSEAVFFINTPNSTYKLKEGFEKEHTLSPWIYEEILFTTVLNKRDWSEYRQVKFEESACFQKSLDIAYPIATERLKTITFEDLCYWNRKWDERKKNDQGRYGDSFLEKHEKIKHALNVLYEMKFGVEK